MVECITPKPFFIGANKQPRLAIYTKLKKIVDLAQVKLFMNPIEPNNKGVYATLKGNEAEVTETICPRFRFYVSSGCRIEGQVKTGSSHYFLSPGNLGDYLLCSGSVDRYIRLWRELGINDLIDDSEEDSKKLTLLEQ
ncbi:ALI_collapsed_G0025250.mRNA.1.CDS.1 [Saccharomyces cerevisiae]|nr:ALI_collapsed_G0025250.mRNA.1.CDS.1 [Saccharomyces cerevisiae]